MTVKELVKNGIITDDHWLTKAKVFGENVKINNGIVTWYGGFFTDGIWKTGVWKNGIWVSGIWETELGLKGSG